MPYLNVIRLHLVISYMTYIIGLTLINNLSYTFEILPICCYQSYRLIDLLAHLPNSVSSCQLNFL